MPSGPQVASKVVYERSATDLTHSRGGVTRVGTRLVRGPVRGRDAARLTEVLGCGMTRSLAGGWRRPKSGGCEVPGMPGPLVRRARRSPERHVPR